jgi:gluconokinase
MMVIVLMGVTGSGKTTVGRMLACEMGWAFLEGDDFHPPGNIDKLSRGKELSDADRRPWLLAIAAAIRNVVRRRESAVISCSALKASYRRVLEVDPAVHFVYLDAAPAVIEARLRRRSGHFMNPRLIASQFRTLQTPRRALKIDAALPPSAIVRIIKESLHLT